MLGDPERPPRLPRWGSFRPSLEPFLPAPLLGFHLLTPSARPTHITHCQASLSLTFSASPHPSLPYALSLLFHLSSFSHHPFSVQTLSTQFLVLLLCPHHPHPPLPRLYPSLPLPALPFSPKPFPSPSSPPLSPSPHLFTPPLRRSGASPFSLASLSRPRVSIPRPSELQPPAVPSAHPALLAHPLPSFLLPERSLRLGPSPSPSVPVTLGVAAALSSPPLRLRFPQPLSPRSPPPASLPNSVPPPPPRRRAPPVTSEPPPSPASLSASSPRSVSQSARRVRGGGGGGGSQSRGGRRRPTFPAFPRPYLPPPHKTRDGGASPRAPQQPSPGKVSPLSSSPSASSSHPLARPLPWVRGPPLPGWGGHCWSWWCWRWG